MFIYKKLKASDANTIAFEAHKEWNINKDNTSSLGITLVETSYSSASRDTYSLIDINRHKQYFQLNHLFYKDALFNYGSLLGGIDYNNQEKRLYDKATIISLSQKTFGSSVQKGTFLFNNLYKDDSKGNLYANTDNLTDYPLDKERTFYLAPVNGFKHVDLTRDPKTGEPIVNYPTTYNDLKLDDSLYINPVEYISCSFARNTTLNCTEINLTNGYIKAPNSNNYNFGNEDFTITFYYQTANVSTTKYVLAKSKTKTVVGYPESNLNGSLKNTHGSASLLQPKEVDAGKAFPFEIIQRDRLIEFKRADQDTEVSHISADGIATADTLYHISCVKTGSELKIYLDGALSNGTGTDTTDLCQNKADLFIGTNPTISSSKLDNTHDQSISQLMIWNRGLTATEIANVSESIDGSPYVGNIFYENGIATITSPKINNTLTTSTTNTRTLYLGATPYIDVGTDTEENPANTFSGSLTFTSSRETVMDRTSLYSNLQYSDTHLTASLVGDNILLASRPYALLEDYIINPIVSESARSFYSYALLDPIVDAIPGGPGTASGETGTDSDSITVTNEPQASYIGLRLAENQTVTQSINVLFISNSQDIENEDFPGTDSTIPPPFTIGNNADTEYVNTSTDGLYGKAATPSGVDAWWSGSMAMTTVQDIPDELQIVNIAMDSTVYVVPDGVITGASYAPFDSGTGITSHRIELLNVGFTFTTQPVFRYRITTSGFTPSLLNTYTLKVRLKEGTGGNQIGYQTFSGASAFSSTISGEFNIADTPQGMPLTPGGKYYLTLEYDTTDTAFPNGGSNNAKFNIDAFGLYQGVSPFNNKLRFDTSISTNLSSLYNITCSGIAPNPPVFESVLTGLKEADDGNKLGIKTLLWKRLNGAGSYSLITQSFYPSGSRLDFKDFHYTHQTSDTDEENLKFIIVADTAENVIPSSIGDINTISTKGVPLSSSFGIGAGSGGEYIVTEISASNVLHIQNGIENHFTASENISSQVIFNDTSNFIGNTTSPVDILGFVSNDSTKLLLNDNYLAISSFASTASLERGNYISGSASIDIADGKGLYIVDKVTLKTNTFSSGTPSGIPTTQKVKIQTKKDGAVVDTRYVDGDNYSSNPFLTTNDKLHLGVLDNTNNVSFEFTVVDSSNNIDKVTKDQGFSIYDIEITQLTSSNEVTRVDGGPFLSNLDALYFSSSHINTGDAAFPFNIGAITASIASISD
jgi:hypothetical protein